MSNEEAQKVLDELNTVRPEVLNGEAKRLFEAIMKIADERDEYKDKLSQIREIFLKYDWKNSNKEEIYNQLKELYERIYGVKIFDE